MSKKTRQWLYAAEAAEILTQNSGRRVSENYVNKLATQTHRVKSIKQRGASGARLYWRADIEAYRVRKRGENLKAKPQQEETHPSVAS